MTSINIGFRVCKIGNESGKVDYLIFRSIGLTKPLAEEVTPKQFKLYHNYPNPFNPRTTIEYDVPKNARVRLNIYNIRG